MGRCSRRACDGMRVLHAPPSSPGGPAGEPFRCLREYHATYEASHGWLMPCSYDAGDLAPM